MRLLLTAMGHTWLDLRILEDDDPEETAREAWPVDGQATLTNTSRVGYVDDVGRDTQPW